MNVERDRVASLHCELADPSGRARTPSRKRRGRGAAGRPRGRPDPAPEPAGAREVGSSLRIGPRGAPVVILVDGEPVPCFAGETVAAALLADGRRELRRSPRTGGPRGAFCLMGACQECAIRIDGQVEPACMVEVRDGLVVECRGALEPEESEPGGADAGRRSDEDEGARPGNGAP